MLTKEKHECKVNRRHFNNLDVYFLNKPSNTRSTQVQMFMGTHQNKHITIKKTRPVVKFYGDTVSEGKRLV